MRSFWRKEIAFACYMTAIAGFIYVAYKFNSWLPLIVVFILIVTMKDLLSKPCENNIVYEIINIKKRTDIVAIKQIIVPDGPIMFPEVLELNGTKFTFLKLSKSPLMDGAYYQKEKHVDTTN